MFTSVAIFIFVAIFSVSLMFYYFMNCRLPFLFYGNVETVGRGSSRGGGTRDRRGNMERGSVTRGGARKASYMYRSIHFSLMIHFRFYPKIPILIGSLVPKKPIFLGLNSLLSCCLRLVIFPCT